MFFTLSVNSDTLTLRISILLLFKCVKRCNKINGRLYAVRVFGTNWDLEDKDNILGDVLV